MKKNEEGFSLLEIIVVIAIIGTILAIAVPMMGNKRQQTSQIFRSITVKFKEVRNRAKLYNSTYRFAFRLTENDQAYWVEKSSSITLIDKKALEEIREKEKNQFRTDDKKDENAPPPAFQADTSFLKKELTLPKGYRFKQIESGSLDQAMTDGTAYIHFFPQGNLEPSAIQIEDPKKNIWTLVFNPITGQADIISEAKTLKDLNR